MKLPLEHVQHVLRAFPESRAAADEVVGAAAAGVERRPWNGEHLASLFKCKASGDERARAECRLDHDNTHGNAGDQAVAAGKVTRLRLGADRHLRDDDASLGNRLVQIAIFFRIDAVDAAGDYRESAGFE